MGCRSKVIFRTVDESHAAVLLAQGGDRRSRDKVVMAYDPLVRSIVNRMKFHSPLDEDGRQEGIIGLLRAIDLFDPTKGMMFSSYAAIWIRAMVLDFMRTSNIVKIDRGRKGACRAVWKAKTLQTDEELAAKLSANVDEVRLVREACKSPVRINVQDYQGERDPERSPERVLLHFDPRDEIHERIAAQEVSVAISKVEPRFRGVIMQHLNGDTYVQIGNRRGISRERARQLAGEATEEIREVLRMGMVRCSRKYRRTRIASADVK